MKRTTIKISEELDTKLRHIAAQRDGTLPEVIREALELYANGRARHSATVSVRGGWREPVAANIASRVEEILAEEWSDPRRS